MVRDGAVLMRRGGRKEGGRRTEGSGGELERHWGRWERRKASESQRLGGASKKSGDPVGITGYSQEAGR